MTIQVYPEPTTSSSNLPLGANATIFSGKSSSGVYTYTSALTAGTYAFQTACLDSSVDDYTVSTTTDSQSITSADGATNYITLNTTVSDLSFTPIGASLSSTSETRIFSQGKDLIQQIAIGPSRYIAATYANTAPGPQNTTPTTVSVGIAYSTDGFAWYEGNNVSGYAQNPSPEGLFAYYNSTNSRYIVVTSGSAHSSTDGITWTNSDIGGGFALTPYTNGTNTSAGAVGSINYAAGNRGSYSYSTDGATWSHNTGVILVNTSCFSGTYGNGIYLTGQAGGRIFKATETESWTYRYAGYGTSVLALTYGNSLYVSAGANGNASTSPDGDTWTSRNIGFAGTGVNALAYGNSLYVAGGDSGKLTTSTDGITWTVRTSQFGSSSIFALAYGNGVYVAGGASGKLASSTDGVTWTAQTSQFGTSIIYGIDYASGIFVAVGAGGRITTSTDGTTWTGQTSGTTSVIRAVKRHDTNWTAAGTSGVLRTSTDAVTWAAATQTNSIGSTILYALASNGTNKVYAIGASGLSTVSTDGITWDTYAAPQPFYNEAILGVTYQGSTYYAWTASARYSSTDGITWGTRTTYTTLAPSVFVVFNGTNHISRNATNAFRLNYSTDGLTWTSGGAYSFSNGEIRQCFYDGTTLYANGYNGSNEPVIAKTTSATVASFTETVLSNATNEFTPNFYFPNLYKNTSSTVPFKYAATFPNKGAGYFAFSTDETDWNRYITTDVIYDVTESTTEIGMAGMSGIVFENKSTGAIRFKDFGTNGSRYGFAYGGGYYLWSNAGGSADFGNAWSTDGVTWTNAAASGSISSLFKIAYGGGIFVGVQSGNRTFVWAPPGGSGTTGTLTGATTTCINQGICYGEGLWAIVFDQGLVATGNGKTMAAAVVPGQASQTWYDGAANKECLVVVGGGGVIARLSRETNIWSIPSSPFTGALYAIAYADGRFITGTSNSNVGTSTDGLTWTLKTIPNTNPWIGTINDIHPSSANNFYISGTGNVIETNKANVPSAYSLYSTSFDTLP